LSDVDSLNTNVNTEASEGKPLVQSNKSGETNPQHTKGADKKAEKEAKKAAKEKAKKDAIEAKERAKREAEEAKIARKEEKKAEKEAKKAAKEKDVKGVEDINITTTDETVKKNKTKKTSNKLYKGEVKLLILPPVDSKILKELEGDLRNTKGLKILLIGGTADGGMQIVLSTEKPVPILNILKKNPQVENVNSNEDTIYISLK